MVVLDKHTETQSENVCVIPIASKERAYAYAFLAFLAMYDVSDKVLSNIVTHVNTNGVCPREHGNRRKKPAHALTTNNKSPRFQKSSINSGYILKFKKTLESSRMM